MDEILTTTIRISRETRNALRRMAEARADIRGGRPSVSGVIAELVAKAQAAKPEGSRAE